MGQMAAIATTLFLCIGLIFVWKSVKIVPQSEVYVIERFGKYIQTLDAGFNVIIPFLDIVRHKVSILEQQLPEFKISAITQDNVEIDLEATVFFRVLKAAESVYRIDNINSALRTAATSVIRSASGKLDLDGMQSSRDSMNSEIAEHLKAAAEIWGIEVTRTEITDVLVDERTKESQRAQLNAERLRRATVAEAEGDKTTKELSADAELYTAQREAEAIRVKADAQAYSIEVEAKANAEQTRLLAEAISNNGQPAIDFEIMKRQVDGLAKIASSENTKTIIVPTDVTATLGSIKTLLEGLKK